MASIATSALPEASVVTVRVCASGDAGFDVRISTGPKTTSNLTSRLGSGPPAAPFAVTDTVPT